MKKVFVIVLLAAVVHISAGQGNNSAVQCKSSLHNSTCKLLDDNHYEVTQYSESGKVVQVGYYLNGKKTGKWTAYNDIGEVISEMNYFKGKKEGKTIVWVPSNDIRYEIIYSKDKIISRYEFKNNSDVLVATK